MEETLHSGERLVILKLGYLLDDPKNTDIVVLRYRKGLKPYQGFLVNQISNRKEMPDTVTEIDYIKRIIGSPNDIIDLKYDKVYLNDQELREPYAVGPTNRKSLEYPMFVPERKFFILGDNRSSSRDSRDIGLVDKSEIIGKAVFRIWPLHKIGMIE